MFDPENTPARDKLGFFLHPDTPCVEESASLANILLMLGYQSLWLEMDDLDATYDSGTYGEGEWIGAKNWRPEATIPRKQCIAICDTEDGPAALFIQKISSARQDRMLQTAMLDYAQRKQNARMDYARRQGRRGWWWPTCTPSSLEEHLKKATAEKDWASVANYAGMLLFKEEYDLGSVRIRPVGNSNANASTEEHF